MKQVYLAHPLSGPVELNLRKAKAWYKWACDHYWPDHCFNAMWIVNCEVYEDANQRDREIGMQRNYAHIRRCDELWLVGEEVSPGMELEASFARRCGIPVYNLTGFEEPLTTVRIEPEDLPVWKPGSMTQQVLFR
jgi:hypothetical protein